MSPPLTIKCSAVRMVPAGVLVMQSYRRNAPSAGPVAFPKLKNSINSDTFAKEVLNKKDVLLLPASIYNYEPSFFRVGFGKSTMRKSLSVFGEFMQDLHKSV